MATEIEIKLAFEDGFNEPQIEALESALKALDICYVMSEKKLVNTYFDTPDFLLNKHKVALRIRRKLDEQGHEVFIQTLKTAGQSINGLSQRGEWEWFVPSHYLNIDELQKCASWPASIPETGLLSVFETNFTRFLANIDWNASSIELVLDWGLVLSNGKQERIHEIELELKQGNNDDLLSLSEHLKQQLSLLPSDLSKAERGFKLFQQKS